MKRAGNLWESLIAPETLYHAFYRVLRGKRSPETTGDIFRDLAFYRVLRGKRSPETTGDIFRDLESELARLHAELADGSYRPGDYRSFCIHKPKERLISAAPLRDRIVHHAVMAVLEPVFERRFIHHSYACRTGKGTHKALRQFVRWGRETRYALKLDIRKFFPSIDYELLKELLARYIKDRRVLDLCGLIIDNSNPQEPVDAYFPGDDLFTPVERRKGLPIGNLTSQWFGNLYFDPLDHFIKEKLRVPRYLRYVDDFACFANDKNECKGWRAEIAAFLETQRLKLHPGKSRTRQVKEGIEFLGFVILPDRVRLNARNLRALRRRMNLWRHLEEKGRLDEKRRDLSWNAWLAHAAHGDTKGLMEGMSVRYDIKMREATDSVTFRCFSFKFLSKYA